MKLLLMHDWKEGMCISHSISPYLNLFAELTRHAIEWADKPQTADKIRLIYFGRMLEDSATLKDCKLDATVGPNVVHMSIRPPDAVEEDADPKQASHAAEEGGRSGCCGCIVM